MSKLDAIANSVFEELFTSFANQSQYYLVAHSFGTLVALRLASMLEKMGKYGQLILIDGSPGYLHRLAQGLRRASQSNDSLENDLIMVLFTHFCNSDLSEGFLKNLQSCEDNLSKKIDLLGSHVSDEFKSIYSETYLRNIIVAIVNRLKVVMSLNVEKDALNGVMDVKLKSTITLIRPTQATFADIVEDYDLNKYTEKEVAIKYVDGNHLTVLEHVELTNILNNITSQAES